MRGALYFLIASAVVIIMGTTGAVLSGPMGKLLIEWAPLGFIGMLLVALGSPSLARHAGVHPVLYDAVASRWARH